MSKIISVFGSSLPQNGDQQYENAYKLGSRLAEIGFDICTGGYSGIMEAVSKGAFENGSEAIGIIVDLWSSIPNKYITKEIRCKNLFERISKLIDFGDGYVILQGGTGTLLELSVVWELMNKKQLQNKPVACHSLMWKEIITIMEKQIIFEGRQTGLVKHFNNVDQIVDFLREKLK